MRPGERALNETLTANVPYSQMAQATAHIASMDVGDRLDMADGRTVTMSDYGITIVEPPLPCREYPPNAWGMSKGVWSNFGEYFPRAGGYIVEVRARSLSFVLDFLLFCGLCLWRSCGCCVCSCC